MLKRRTLAILVNVLKPIIRSDASRNGSSNELDHSVTRAWMHAAVGTLPAENQPDARTLAAAIFSAEAMADDHVFVSALDAFSTACRERERRKGVGGGGGAAA